MPEGPECHRIAHDLNALLKSKTLTSLQIVGGRYLKNPPANFEEFSNDLPQNVSSVGARGKSIWFDFDSQWVLFSSLGLTGIYALQDSKYTRVKFQFGEIVVNYIDTRNFGAFRFCDEPDAISHRIRRLGIDLLLDEPDLALFVELALKKPNRTVTEMLMDQSILAGVGNYIKCEILYAARLHPLRKVIDLNISDFEAILNAAVKVMKLSFQMGGVSVKDYRQLNGRKGNFQDHLQVYRKKYTNGQKVERMQTPDGRNTYWVPSAQK